MKELYRIFHWGPITALLIIKCVILTTLLNTSMWLPPSSGLIALLNHLIYLLLMVIILYNFFCAIFIGPGVVPLKWHPNNLDDCKYLQYCQTCEGYKPPRAHHCRKCDRCIMKMDHHCPWINNCCGYKNHANFTYFLLAAVIGSIHSTVLLINSFYRAYHFTWYYYNDPDHLVYLTVPLLIFTVFSIGLSIGVFIAVGGLFVIQAKSIIRNQTGIEEWIVTKALSRKRNDTFVYPYNLGFWNNIKQVLFESTNNGISWPVLLGCTQFTLTIEQLLQKEEKRTRACQYKIIDNYNGSWFPLFSQGFRVCISFPLTDEPRIKLNINDIVVVTRWKKHWLYGEKILTTTTTNTTTNTTATTATTTTTISSTMSSATSTNNSKVERKRGWFPRKCAVEVIIPTNNSTGFTHNKQNYIHKKIN